METSKLTQEDTRGSVFFFHLLSIEIKKRTFKVKTKPLSLWTWFWPFGMQQKTCIPKSHNYILSDINMRSCIIWLKNSNPTHTLFRDKKKPQQPWPWHAKVEKWRSSEKATQPRPANNCVLLAKGGCLIRTSVPVETLVNWLKLVC